MSKVESKNWSSNEFGCYLGGAGVACDRGFLRLEAETGEHHVVTTQFF